MPEAKDLMDWSRQVRQEAAWLRERSSELIAGGQRISLESAALITLDERYREEVKRRYGPAVSPVDDLGRSTVEA
jgi:hypothetical protein